MPKLSDATVVNPVKMLLIGHSGSGKTGALASLALAGYKLRILDYDKGLESLSEAIKKENPDALANVSYESLSDKMQTVGGKVIPKGVPKSIQEGLALMDNWSPKSKSGAEDLGKPADWGMNDILVIDSLTHLSNAALRYVQTLNSNAGGKVTQPEWGDAQRIIEQMLTYLYSGDFKTNVIITSHIQYVQESDKQDEKGNPDGELKGHPMSLGRALPPKIPSYFNHMLLMESRGAGQFTKRFLTTVPNGVINTKSPILSGIPKELPIDTGLAMYFDTALGKKNKQG